MNSFKPLIDELQEQIDNLEQQQDELRDALQILQGLQNKQPSAIVKVAKKRKTRKHIISSEPGTDTIAGRVLAEMRKLHEANCKTIANNIGLPVAQVYSPCAYLTRLGFFKRNALGNYSLK